MAYRSKFSREYELFKENERMKKDMSTTRELSSLLTVRYFYAKITHLDAGAQDGRTESRMHLWGRAENCNRKSTDEV